MGPFSPFIFVGPFSILLPCLILKTKVFYYSDELFFLLILNCAFYKELVKESDFILIRNKLTKFKYLLSNTIIYPLDYIQKCSSLFFLEIFMSNRSYEHMY